jgi:hypothetical protein
MSSKTPGATAPIVTTDLAALGRMTFDSLLSDAQVEEFEAQQAEWTKSRRLMLLALNGASEKLVASFNSGDGPDEILELIGNANAYKAHCKTLVEMAEIAVARLIAVAAACIEQGSEK